MHDYAKRQHLDVDFPRRFEAWTPSQVPSSAAPPRADLEDGEPYDSPHAEIAAYVAGKPWIWASRDIFFLTDIHADIVALRRSLYASGGVELTGPEDCAFELTPAGHHGKFIFGGDFFDKGPSNLRLLRGIKRLIDCGADVDFLCGNHDMRTFLGLHHFGATAPEFAHFFVRMGPKCIPLFFEIYCEYLLDEELDDLPSDDEIRAMIFPMESWWDEFPRVASAHLSDLAIAKELARIRYKVEKIESRADEEGLSLRRLFAAVQKARELFLKVDGEFAWLFARLRIARRYGSLLFVHAGVCDHAAKLIENAGIDGLQACFLEAMRTDTFGLYHGMLGNVFRTKYRRTDKKFSASGVAALQRAGLYAIVHGHRNVLSGQRSIMRHGILNFECDASVDENTRRLEGVDPRGGAATIFSQNASVFGVSTDYPAIKVQDIRKLSRFLTIAPILDGEIKPMNKSVDLSSAFSNPEIDCAEGDKNEAVDKRRTKVSFETSLLREEAAAYLESLAAGLRLGELGLCQEDARLDLAPASSVTMGIRAGQKGTKEKIRLEFSWYNRHAPAVKLIAKESDSTGA